MGNQIVDHNYRDVTLLLGHMCMDVVFTHHFTRTAIDDQHTYYAGVASLLDEQPL